MEISLVVVVAVVDQAFNLPARVKIRVSQMVVEVAVVLDLDLELIMAP
jgi:hypothetical protein